MELASQQRLAFAVHRERVEDARGRPRGEEVRRGAVVCGEWDGRPFGADERVQRAGQRPLEEHRRQPRGPVLGIRPVRLRRLATRSDDLSTVQRLELDPSLPVPVIVLGAAGAGDVGVPSFVDTGSANSTNTSATGERLRPAGCKSAATSVLMSFAACPERANDSQASRRALDLPPRSCAIMWHGEAHRSPHRDRPRAPEGFRSRPRAGVLFGRARLRADATHGSARLPFSAPAGTTITSG